MVACRYEISLLLLNSKRNSISARTHVLFSISRALLGIPIIRLLHQYHAHFWDFFHSIVMLVSRALLGLPFIGLLRLYLAHFKDSLSLDYHVSISCTFRILFHWIVAFVSRALFQDLFHTIATLVSSAPLGFPFIRLLHQSIAQFQDSLSLDDYVGTLNNFKILFHWIATSVSRALLRFSII